VIRQYWTILADVSGLRERNKAKRRDAILDAAGDLLRAQDLSSVTMEQIAAKAEVSPATVYNLIGSRDRVLFGLVDRVVSGLVDSLAGPGGPRPDDPIAAVRLIVDQSVAAFASDSAVYRQIVGSAREFTRAGMGITALAIDPAQLLAAALADARKLGIIRRGCNPEALGRQIYVSYLGGMLAWAYGGLSDEGFAIAARHGLLAVLAAAATDDHRDPLVAEWLRLGRQLTAAGWGPPSA
jgi:AcrR family transcriptional regulator